MTKLNLELMEGEKILTSGGGGFKKGIIGFFFGCGGGKIFLTNKRIIHQTTFRKKITEIIDLKEIADLKIIRPFFWINTLLILKAIKITMKNRKTFVLGINDKKGWIIAINAAIKDA